ncbi:MAG: ATP-binding cassette domain-containing protein [Gemmatimonadetes bacterium]|nr:ATP-binding cassette domain-containing protein [Gemmatimonadota bacterium]
MASKEVLLRLRDVRLPTADPDALTPPLSLDLEAGQVVAVCAPVGAGAVLIRACLGLTRLTAGELEILGVKPWGLPQAELDRVREQVGTVLHPHGLVSNVTIRGNVLLPLLYGHGAANPDAQDRVADLLAALGLTALAGRRPDAAGPGTCERVAVARALARRPRLLLLENLDASLTPQEIGGIMILCRGEVGTVLLTATDSGAAACGLCDRVLDLSAG